MGTNDLLPSARHCCPLFVHKNMSELSVIPKASKFFSSEQHICCQIVVAKIISKMQGEQKCLHVVVIFLFYVDVILLSCFLWHVHMSGDLCCKPISPRRQITVTIYLIVRPRLKKSTTSYKLHSNSNACIAILTILFINKST